MPMSIQISSGIIAQGSGSQPSPATTFTVQPLPVQLAGSGDVTPINSFTGGDGNKSINVNISGGSVSVSISGGIQTQIPGYQSGSLVGISGGQAALSGLNVIASVSIAPFAYQSGTEVGISGGQLALSGLNVILAGTTTSGGHTISGGVTVSGNVSILNITTVPAVSGTTGSGTLAVAMMVYDYSGLKYYPAATLSSGTTTQAVSVVNQIPVGVVPLNNFLISGSPLLLTSASGGIALPNLNSTSVVITNHSGNTPLFIGSTSGAPYPASGGATQSISSGFGYILEGGASFVVDIANPSTMKIVHTTSGSLVSYAVVLS
jgi:hypothetical protein